MIANKTQKIVKKKDFKKKFKSKFDIFSAFFNKKSVKNENGKCMYEFLG